MPRIDIDLSDVEEIGGGFGPIDPGHYEVKVEDTEVKKSKAGNLMLVVTFEVTGPKFSGRRIWVNFVLNHPVGKGKLKGLLRALGYGNPDRLNDSDEIHGLSCIAKVGIDDRDAGRNVITSFSRPKVEKKAAPAVKKRVENIQQSDEKPKVPWKEEDDDIPF